MKNLSESRGVPKNWVSRKFFEFSTNDFFKFSFFVVNSRFGLEFDFEFVYTENMCESGLDRKFFRLGFLLVLFLFAAPFFAVSESFRVHKSQLLTVSASGDKSSVRAGVNDSLVIQLPDDLTFVEGVELTFKVPQEVAAWRDSVVWSFYDGVYPSPSEKTIDYSGVRSTTGTFGSSYSLTLKIPLSRKNSIKRDAYSQYVSAVPDVVDGKIFIRLQLAMKGTSDDIHSAQFQVTAKPLFINKGKLRIQAAAPGGGTVQPYTVFVDGAALSVPKDGVLLSPGVHNINIVSEYYRNEMRTVTVEQAKYQTLSLDFRSITPTIRVAAPGGTRVFIDDEALEDFSEPVEVSQGDHVVRFMIGDYETVRQVSAMNGRSYTVAVKVDATVTEEE